MNIETNVGVFDLIILFGVVQGFVLAFFFIKKSTKENKANLLQGLLVLFLTMSILEELLNNTGYIVKVLPISDFSEPLNFTFAPLLYLYFKSCIHPNRNEKPWLHFIPSIFWLLYMVFYFVQPNELKYNSYVETKHPDWEYLTNVSRISDDPIGIRNYINQLTLVQFLIYIVYTVSMLMKEIRTLKQSFFKLQNRSLRLLRNSLIHFCFIVFIYLVTKLYFGMSSDVGGYFIATYISYMFFVNSFQIMNNSYYFSFPGSFLDFPAVKYKKSSLDESDKQRIQQKLKKVMEVDLYFTSNLVSLSNLSKLINETTHHVSQVINEKYGKSFFEFIADYRVEEAKKIILADKQNEITIEDLADRVGYNSKSSFNKVFKTYTSQTPSEFRQQKQRSER